MAVNVLSFLPHFSLTRFLPSTFSSFVFYKAVPTQCVKPTFDAPVLEI